MSKLNQKNVVQRAVGLSGNGNLQYVKDASQRLMEYVLASFYAADGFYTSAESKMDDMIVCIDSLVRDNKMQTIEAILQFAKNDMGMRTMPIVATVHYFDALRRAGKQAINGRYLVTSMIVRADELTDMYAYALKVFGDKGSVPMAIKRGVADAFSKFNEYQFGKYNRDNAVKLSDLIRITHPVPLKYGIGEVFAKIVKNTLQVPYTWETEFSANGQLPEAERKPKAQIWGELLAKQSLGFLAAIRNVRNIVESGANVSTIRALQQVIAKGHDKVLPFQVFQAYRSTPETSVTLRDTLVDAVEKAVQNVPAVGERVWVILDVSGSMMQKLSAKSEVVAMDNAAVLTASLIKAQLNAGKQVVVTLFSDRATSFQVSRHMNTVEIAKTLLNRANSGGTNLLSAYHQYDQVREIFGEDPDTLFVFSDMQVNAMHTGAYSYRAKPSTIPAAIKRIPVKVAVNFAAEKTTPLAKEDGFIQLTGFSEKIFQLVDYLRNWNTLTARFA
jgi:hypothetical protein